MSTWFSKPNQSLISKVTKKRVGFNLAGFIDLLQVDLNGFPSERSESKTMDNINHGINFKENLRLSFNDPKRKV